MRKIIPFSMAIALIVITMLALIAPGGHREARKTIQYGKLCTPYCNSPVDVGYDDWGFNYGTHTFVGFYENFSRPGMPVTQSTTLLKVNWNDAWLSNRDNDEDGLLDYTPYGGDCRGSGAWCKNEIQGKYEKDGEIYIWKHEIKIIAVPVNAVLSAPYDVYGNGTWYTANGQKIGPQIWSYLWDGLAIMQETVNDSCDELSGKIEGRQYGSPVAPGVAGKSTFSEEGNGIRPLNELLSSM